MSVSDADVSYHSNIFTVVGHGTEEFTEFSDRDTVPDGYTLVTLTKMADTSKMSDVCPILSLLSKEENRVLLSDPIRNKNTIQDRIGHNIRIYSAGRKYPKLSVKLLADWTVVGKRKNYKQIIQSGVHKFPIESPDVPPFIDISEEEISIIKSKYFEIDKYIGVCGKFIHYFPQELIIPNQKKYRQIVFYNSLIPTPEESKNVHTPVEKTLNEIMAELGPGIYYFIACRSIPSRPTSFFDVTVRVFLDFNFKELDREGLLPEDIKILIPSTKEVIKNIATEINEESDYVEKLRIFLERVEEIPRPVLNFMYSEWTGKDYVDVPTSFKNEIEFLNKISRVRANSNIEQLKEFIGGRRLKTRRIRRTRRVRAKAHRTHTRKTSKLR